MTRLLAAIFILFAAPAFGGGSSVFRFASERMSCRQAQSAVAKNGAVLMMWGRDFSFYERVVFHNGFCQLGEITAPTVAPTRDDGFCNVGYKCEANKSGDGGGDGGNSGGGNN